MTRDISSVVLVGSRRMWPAPVMARGAGAQSTILPRTEHEGIIVATQTITQYTDDIDGSEAVGTFRISVTDEHGQAVAVEIDLSEDNAAALNDFLAPYVEHGRKPAKAASNGRAERKPQRSTRGGETALIRQWARGQGITVPTRGRIPAAVMARYEARG